MLLRISESRGQKFRPVFEMFHAPNMIVGFCARRTSGHLQSNKLSLCPPKPPVFNVPTYTTLSPPTCSFFSWSKGQKCCGLPGKDNVDFRTRLSSLQRKQCQLWYEPIHGRTTCQPDLTTSLQPRVRTLIWLQTKLYLHTTMKPPKKPSHPHTAHSQWDISV